MCRQVLEVRDPVTNQWRSRCPDHPDKKLREGIGCPTCGWGAGQEHVVRQKRRMKQTQTTNMW